MYLTIRLSVQVFVALWATAFSIKITKITSVLNCIVKPSLRQHLHFPQVFGKLICVVLPGSTLHCTVARHRTAGLCSTLFARCSTFTSII